MPYRSSSKTRQKKDAKRTAMMQAAIQVFADKGYHTATIREIVSAANVAIGTFYFYFPDKETLFIHLYEETAEFLLQAIRQATNTHTIFPEQTRAGLQAYVNIAIYEPAVVQLLLVGSAGTVASINILRTNYRDRLISIWHQLLEDAQEAALIPSLNCRRMAEALTGAFDEVILNLLSHPSPDTESTVVINEMLQFCLRATAYTGKQTHSS